MDINHQKEQFSKAYVRAVISVAGYTVYEPEVDDDSVDLGVAARGAQGTVRSPRLELQLKCTSQEINAHRRSRRRSRRISLQDIAGLHGFHFPLPLKNYNDLRGEDLLVPRILVVVIVPNGIDDWLYQSEEEMTMKRCGYWCSLREYNEVDNQTSVTVTIPRNQMFTVEALKGIMNGIANGGKP